VINVQYRSTERLGSRGKMPVYSYPPHRIWGLTGTHFILSCYCLYFKKDFIIPYIYMGTVSCVVVASVGSKAKCTVYFKAVSIIYE
jgi:hypothetical protein